MLQPNFDNALSVRNCDTHVWQVDATIERLCSLLCAQIVFAFFSLLSDWVPASEGRWGCQSSNLRQEMEMVKLLMVGRSPSLDHHHEFELGITSLQLPPFSVATEPSLQGGCWWPWHYHDQKFKFISVHSLWFAEKLSRVHGCKQPNKKKKKEKKKKEKKKKETRKKGREANFHSYWLIIVNVPTVIDSG